MTEVASTWTLDSGARIAIHERQAAETGSVVGELELQGLPWRLERPAETDSSNERCELLVDCSAQPVKCRQLSVELVSSARHMELYVYGVRRNLLGEEETSEVYFGTFRGAKTEATTPSAAAATQFFRVSEEFLQSKSDHDVLKCIHKIRIKFVSLTGDKTALELVNFNATYVPLTPHRSTPAAASGTPPLPSAADLMGLMAGMSVGDSPGAMNPQFIMLAMQQMMEREIETKITQVLDAKLSILSQRLAFSEQMLLQVQQRSDTKGAYFEKRLEKLQNEVISLRHQITPAEEGKMETEETKEEEEEEKSSE
ncbi:hypothetical protein Poli38472_008635 [Pythium oligandrum]|uniref:Uncharacterized protein n=1 Tax=Pythium oligandrum TaxID=41045 RepID=A0A8K1C3W0_PYTOL|nr:hypothetical protein Poli38472_008635 [Pythium oligandrum]|eukprot:TMW55987.1 hypothetical protein Poli38472_008635 [Pythium oligandrum]